jgi:hypothetical protein
MIERSNLIIIARDLSISMKVENRWPLRIVQVETARDGYPGVDRNGKVEGMPRGITDILSWIKNEI